MRAAIFKGPKQPLVIDQVDIDKPRGREVLVKTDCVRRMPQRPAFRRWRLADEAARDPGA